MMSRHIDHLIGRRYEAIVTDPTPMDSQADDGTLTRSGKLGAMNACNRPAKPTAMSVMTTPWASSDRARSPLRPPTALRTAKSRVRSSAVM